MRIDLHTHSSCSDGTDTPSELVANAAAAGLDVIALTDHDTTAGWDAAALAGDRHGVRVVPGTEISCRFGARGGTQVHLLAYDFDRGAPEFAEERARLRDDREHRAELITERCRELGAPINWEQVQRIARGASIGRPHVASALVEAGVVPSVDAAFSGLWLADGGRAYVEKYALDPVHAIRLVRDAGGTTVFAHPAAAKRGRIVSDAEIAMLADAGLRGLEADHPDHDEPTRARMKALARDLNLVATGSSDYHGARKSVVLGECTTDPEAFAALLPAYV